MERVLHKFQTKIWWVKSKPEIALLILKQIETDIREFISTQLANEMVRLNLYPKFRVHRSWSVPNIGAIT